MNSDAHGIFVARDARGAFVRVNGRGTFQNAELLREFGVEALNQGCSAICFDLEGCRGMDSTFLGVLAGFGLKLRELGRQEGLRLFNAGQRTLESCQLLGLDRLACLEPGPPTEANSQPPPASDFRRLADSDPPFWTKPEDKSAIAEVMLQAHDDLCQCDQRNETKFKDVKKLLQDKVEGQSPKPQSSGPGGREDGTSLNPSQKTGASGRT